MAPSTPRKHSPESLSWRLGWTTAVFYVLSIPLYGWLDLRGAPMRVWALIFGPLWLVALAANLVGAALGIATLSEPSAHKRAAAAGLLLNALFLLAALVIFILASQF